MEINALTHPSSVTTKTTAGIILTKLIVVSILSQFSNLPACIFSLDLSPGRALSDFFSLLSQSQNNNKMYLVYCHSKKILLSPDVRLRYTVILNIIVSQYVAIDRLPSYLVIWVQPHIQWVNETLSRGRKEEEVYICLIFPSDYLI